MKTTGRWILAGVIVLGLTVRLGAVELTGRVIEVVGRDVRVRIDGDQNPQAGDPLRVTFQTPDGLQIAVGTWRVVQVTGDTVLATVVEATGPPAVGHAATIDAPRPVRRAAPAAVTPGTAAAAAAAAGGKGLAPSPASPRTVDLTKWELPVGPLKLGEGRRERVGAAYVIVSSSGYYTHEPIATGPAREFHAAVRIRVERGSRDQALAGLAVTEAASGDFRDGDLFFGKSDSRGLILQRMENGRWTDVAMLPHVLKPAADQIDRFEIVKQGGRYEFALNGGPVASLDQPAPREEWLRILAGDGNRAEFYEWRVEARQ